MVNECMPKGMEIKTDSLPYAVYLPSDYDKDPEKRWPLLIFLHGAGERGADLQLVYRHGPFREIREGREFPFVVIAPQIAGQKYWACYAETLNAMLDRWLEEYRVDASRVYLTGLSMGGTGTWMWGMMNPERFAAIMPLCGTGICWCAGNLASVPVWAFHGDLDDIVPPEETLRMTQRLRLCGGDVRFTLCEGKGHDCWTDVYHRDDVYLWLLTHRKEIKE